ncbi:hypothetical protein C7271_26125, partial [filamentous cyanobacterium CCP5]
MASAQLIPDSTLGTESSVVGNSPVQGAAAELVEGGATRGSNLFHSFADFNVGDLQRVYFANPAGILDIYTRVTGSNSSSILGTLGVDGSANLFLLNPNGIIFGPNAQIDIAGSFTASTADRLQFSDGNTFSAVDPDAPPLLQINITPGLQYGPQPAELSNQGQLAIGQTLTLGAQRLNLAGELEAGRDIVLQGGERQLSAADYTVGGYLFTQDLSGAGVEMVIPHDHVILADGDLRLDQNYTGESLYMLAGGQVSQAEEVNQITVTGTTGGSATETLSDGTGETQTVTVAAGAGPTVDIRSGLNWPNLIGSSPGNQNNSGLAVTFGPGTGQGLSLSNVTNSGGAIALQSGDSLRAGVLDTSVETVIPDQPVLGIDGGKVTLTADRDITASFLNTQATAGSPFNVVGGSGGDIRLRAGGNITLDSFTSASNSFSSNGDVMGDRGGNGIFAARRNITFTDQTASFARSASATGNVTGGQAGDMTLIAGQNISTTTLGAFSLVLSGSFLAVL